MTNLQIKNLTAKYEDKIIFENFNCNFDDGKVTVLLGGSGTGKTTLLSVIANTIKYEGEIQGVGEVSYVFQSERLIPTISIYKNLDLVIKRFYKDKKEREAQIVKILNDLEIEECKNQLPTEISGGQAKRVSLARAFLYPSQTLLMDEPFSSLDIALKSRICKVFDKLESESPKTVLYVTHSIDEALLLGDRILVIDGRPAQIVADVRIETPRNERDISDENLGEVRKQLLSALVKS